MKGAGVLLGGADGCVDLLLCTAASAVFSTGGMHVKADPGSAMPGETCLLGMFALSNNGKQHQKTSPATASASLETHCADHHLSAGAAFMASPNFSLSQMVVANNTAYLGGGLFLGADLADNVSISGMQFTGNSALLGRHTPNLRLHTSCLYAEQGCEEAAAALGPCRSSEAYCLGCLFAGLCVFAAIMMHVKACMGICRQCHLFRAFSFAAGVHHMPTFWQKSLPASQQWGIMLVKRCTDLCVGRLGL